MSIISFTLTEDHIKLARQINFIKNESNEPIIHPHNPFGSGDMYEDVNLIINGKVREVKLDDVWDFDYSDEEKEMFNKLISELSTALDIILFTGKFEPGDYFTRSYERNWVKR